MGYNVGEYTVKVRRPAPSFGVKLDAHRIEELRRPVAFYPSVLGYRQPDGSFPCLVPFYPDQHSTVNLIAGACHRYAAEMPPVDEAIDFVLFGQTFIRQVWRDPVRNEEVPTFAHWLANSDFPPARKKQMLRAYFSQDDPMKVTESVKTFVKHECWEEPKAPRKINPFDVYVNVLLGPLFHAVDKKTFQARWFVKGSDPRSWAKRMRVLFEDSPVVETDFTAFEGHHRGPYAYLAYYWALHMTRGLSGCRHLRDLICRLMLGGRKIVTRVAKMTLDQRLMSGALWTSSANGVLNLIIMAYTSAKAVLPLGSVGDRVRWCVDHLQGFVEGDDGIFLDVGQSEDVVRSIGAVVKLARARAFGEAKFCGVICDPEALENVKNPREVLRKFLLLPSKYMASSDNLQKSLLRAKALSYYTILRNCPVVGPLCEWVLRETSGIDVTRAVRNLEPHHKFAVRIACREKLWKLHPDVKFSSRCLVAERFGITIYQQLEIEDAFMKARGFAFFDSRSLSDDLTMQHRDDYVCLDPSRWVPPQSHDLPSWLSHIMRHGKRPDRDEAVAEIDRAFERALYRAWPARFA